MTDKEKAIQEIVLLERQAQLKRGLPFLYGWKHYPWSRKFFESTNKENFLVAANQVGKSSTNIRKCIHWATAQELWPTLWNVEAFGNPNQFWYFYPTKEVATIEFKTKWSLFLPRDEFKNHPVYGWKEEYDAKQIVAIHFNSGVTVYFKTYKQDIKDLQTGTVYSMFCFTKGHKVLTPQGFLNVEDVNEGDYVLSHKGHRRVVRALNREESVVSRTFLDGTTLTGTLDHPVFIGTGYKELGLLATDDTCYTSVAWKLIEKLYCLREVCSSDNQKAKMLVGEIILEIVEEDLYTFACGNLTTINECQKALLYIIKILSRLITVLETCSFLPEQSTQEYISLLNGRKQDLLKKLATGAEKYSWEVKWEELTEPFVADNVEKITTESSILAAIAEIRSCAEKILRKNSVLPLAQTEVRREKVYNLEVDDAHTYFCNGLLTHNCDEELPLDYLPELQARLNATDGYFHLVFTATLGQEHWRRCMEEQGGSLETHKGALKINASLYDCMKFEDGTASHWTEEKIQRAIAKCPTQAEVKRRIFGRFVVADGLKYAAFDPEKNSSISHPLPKSWYVYAGVDVGSGGESGHPAAIVFVGVSPDYKQGRVFQAWRGDGVVTTPTDVLLKFREMRGNLRLQAQFYDWASKDFFNIAASMGESFQPAEKSHEIGEGVLNTLFRHKMLSIQRGEADLEKLVAELSTILVTTPKNKAADDLADALRYTVTGIPWDYAAVDENIDLEKALLEDLREKPPEKKLSPYEQVDEERFEAYATMKKQQEMLDVPDELDEWQELYDS